MAAWPGLARPAAVCLQVRDPSLLRFLVDMRGEDVTNKQLRDDLMTMLIAGARVHVAAPCLRSQASFRMHACIQLGARIWQPVSTYPCKQPCMVTHRMHLHAPFAQHACMHKRHRPRHRWLTCRSSYATTPTSHQQPCPLSRRPRDHRRGADLGAVLLGTVAGARGQAGGGD